MIRKWVESPLIFLTILFSYAIGLWGFSVPLTGDQKVYLSVAMEMRERGEWIIPYLFDAPNFLKPPLQYWATIIGWFAFGFNTFGSLIPSVFALLFCSYLIKKIYQHFFAANGNLAALLFAASIGTMTYGTTAQMEIWVVLFYLLPWYAWLIGHEWFAFLAVGILAWAKGPLYSAFFVFGVIAYELIQKNWKKLVHPLFVAQLIFGIAIGLSWYALAARTHLQEVLDIFLKQENVSKLGGNQSSPFSLWGEFFYTLFPWLICVLFSVSGQINHVLPVRFKEFLKFAAAYSIIPAIFFTVFPYRVNTYLYFLTPIFAIFVGFQAKEGIPEDAPVIRFIAKPLALILGASLLFLLFRLHQGQWITHLLFAGMTLMVLAWMYAHIRLNIFQVGLISLVLVMLVRIAAVQIGEFDLRDLRSILSEKQSSGLAYYIDQKNIWHEIALISAAVGKPIVRLYTPEDLQKFTASGGTVIFSDEQLTLKQSFTQNLRCEHWNRFRRHLRFPIEVFIKKGLSRDASELHSTHYICSAH